MDDYGLELVEATVSTTADVKQATESIIDQVDAFYVITDNTVVSAFESVADVTSDKKCRYWQPMLPRFHAVLLPHMVLIFLRLAMKQEKWPSKY